jgi:hypothetical protein
MYGMITEKNITLFNMPNATNQTGYTESNIYAKAKQFKPLKCRGVLL